jgi:hypothetical protein
MMASQQHPEEAKMPALNLVVFKKVIRTISRNGMIILIGLALALPACKTHKRCEAYSSIQKKKGRSKHCPAYSFNAKATPESSWEHQNAPKSFL